MRTKSILLFFLLSAVALVGVSCGGGDPGDPREVQGQERREGEDQFEVGLVRIPDLEPTGRTAFANIGADPLAAGQVEVEQMGKNQVEAKVQGAAANATYAVNFCSFAAGPAGCSAVATLATDAAGNGKAEFAFPQRGGFAGVFVLTRAGQNQFVTGFTVPAPSSGATAGEKEEKKEAFEVNLQPVSAIGAGLGAGFGPAGDDPLAQGQVEVERGREVEVRVAGAVANATYAVQFCRFGAGPSGCAAIGSFSTDAQGNAQPRLGFPLAGTFDGVFILTRNVGGAERNEFVTGFRIL